MIAGTVHVLTGPDHLTAIAPLACINAKARGSLVCDGASAIPPARSVGLLSLWLRDKLPSDLISSWGDRIVGVVLFGIGLWTLRRALKHNVHTHEHEHHGERHVHFHTHHSRVRHGTRRAPTPHACRLCHWHVARTCGQFAFSRHPADARVADESAGHRVSGCVWVGTILAMALFSWGMGRYVTRDAPRMA